METPTPTSISVPTLPLFFMIFITIYLLGYFKFFRNWTGVSRPEASSCLISLAHGTPAVLLSTYSIRHHSAAQHGFASLNTAFQNTVLDYSLAYFFTDTLHYILFVPTDVLFITHHLATIYVLATCRYMVGHGAVAILSLLAIAEVTSACQNAWSLARLGKAAAPSAATATATVAAGVYEFLSPVFFAFYSVVRGVVGPAFVYRIGVFYWSRGAEDVIPKWVWISWMVVIVSAILMSMLWVLSLWIDLYRERSKKKEMKKSS